MSVSLTDLIQPELLLTIAACALFLLGVINRPAARKVAPAIALAALAWVFVGEMTRSMDQGTAYDAQNSIRIFQFGSFIRILTCGVGMILVLLAWPTNPEGTGNSALNFGQESGEFFGLMLLSITGVLLVAGANDLILLFLGIELASIPTYIMVSISRPMATAQEAGVKYFFLGAMSAAVMLFGFSYLYGTTGLIHLVGQTQGGVTVPGLINLFHASDPQARTSLTSWQMLAVVMVLAGFAFKIAAVPMHFYAGDVYQGAATPMTAFLSFVPKTSGMVAIIKLLYVVGGGTWGVPLPVVKLLWIMAVLTMTTGNVLGLLQFNIKRVLAYSSIAHSGYMLAGLVAVVATRDFGTQDSALQGVLFYLATYGIASGGIFGALMLLPSRSQAAGQHSAETFEDLAGQGRRRPGLGLAMAACCFSLTGLPLTAGFFGKLFIIRPVWGAAAANPAMHGMMIWLIIAIIVNAAISAAYYLKIVATLFLRPDPVGIAPPRTAENASAGRQWPVLAGLSVSVIGTLVLGIVLPVTEQLTGRTVEATQLESFVPGKTPPVADLPAETPTRLSSSH